MFIPTVKASVWENAKAKAIKCHPHLAWLDTPEHHKDFALNASRLVSGYTMLELDALCKVSVGAKIVED